MTTYLKDYQVPNYQISQVELIFDLAEERTCVISQLKLKRQAHTPAHEPLFLNGEQLELHMLKLNGQVLYPNHLKTPDFNGMSSAEYKSKSFPSSDAIAQSFKSDSAQAHYVKTSASSSDLGIDGTDYQVDETGLTILNPPSESFLLETTVFISPKTNKTLSGLYISNDNYCTQCESHGFRRITYFLDRPDVLSYFTTTIRADKSKFPQLLSNGNQIDACDLADGRHQVVWQDPSLKPCYLFALVAGDFDCLSDQFITQSGRNVDLKLYVEKGFLDQTQHAMASLQRAMRWDEEKYGREYDLDIYMIVAVSDFNFGAMENKGLNIFNTKYVLANAQTATDADLIAVEGVVAHEYFHNWSGNRVTCRDWFQLSLKEGLTVFRDQSFTEDQVGQAVTRIDDVKIIRSAQFAQDAGPMAHPIRPDHFDEINNFYTVTVYNKGAEVIRMLHTLLGQEKYRQGTDLYFSRFDGQAVTTEDFVACMSEVSEFDLTQFERWYHQAGTPILTVTDRYDEATQYYHLTIEQHCDNTADGSEKLPFFIPLRIGLFTHDGQQIPLMLKQGSLSDSNVLHVTQEVETFIFESVDEQPIVSLNRGFSAPVKMNYTYSIDSLLCLMQHETDGFNRWDITNQLLIGAIQQANDSLKQGGVVQIDQRIINAYQCIVDDDTLDCGLKARLLTLPTLAELIAMFDQVRLEYLAQALDHYQQAISIALRSSLLVLSQQNKTGTAEYDSDQIGLRALKNASMKLLAIASTPEIRAHCVDQYQCSRNMTNEFGALIALNQVASVQRNEQLAHFYRRWQSQALVVDKWLSLQATAHDSLEGGSALSRVQVLLEHEAYDACNPNKVRALVGQFCVNNPIAFHVIDGSGYHFLQQQILEADRFNPQLAARLVEPLIYWRKFDLPRQQLMKQVLERIKQNQGLSNDVKEVVTKSLISA